MKKILLFVAVWISAMSLSIAQCNPMNHDWQGAAFGVSPDPNLGESFVDGYLGENYSDVVYVLAPENVGDVDSLYEDFNIEIDSISLDSITIFNGIGDVQLSNIGLNVTCNNNGDSPNPCHFLPGNAYCGDIFGVPTAAGEYQVKIFVTVYFLFIGSPQALPYSFDNYTLNILDGVAVLENTVTQNVLNQNSPNPALVKTQISYELMRSQKVRFEVRNLVGQLVYSQEGISKKGTNTIELNTTQFESGIYIYSIQMDDKKLSRRMVVQK